MVFLRSGGGTDPVTRLWVLDVAEDGTAAERCVVDPAALLAGAQEDLPAQERARRERLREVAGGVTAYAVDRAVRTAAFALSGRPWVVALDDPGATARELDAPGPVVDPRPDPTGSRVAFASDGGLHVVELARRVGRTLCAAESDGVTWGLADFIAAEELERYRGFWWTADGQALLVERVDVAPVGTWWIADPSQPAAPATAHRYPAAGTANADLSLWLVGLDGSRREVEWDHEELPYLASVAVTTYGDPVVALLSRDQRTSGRPGRGSR